MTDKVETKVDLNVVFGEFLKEKIAKEPEAIVGTEGSDHFGPRDKIPGFDQMTFELAGSYEIPWKDVPVLLDLKTKFYEPHVVLTAIGLHVVRGSSRREWSELQKSILVESEARFKEHQERKSSEAWARQDVQFRTEEMIVVNNCVYPKYDKGSVRSIPAGVVSVLAESCVKACGFEPKNGLPAIKL